MDQMDEEYERLVAILDKSDFKQVIVEDRYISYCKDNGNSKDVDIAEKLADELTMQTNHFIFKSKTDDDGKVWIWGKEDPCPDDEDYECYGCGNETGRGYDSGLCHECYENQEEEERW